VTAALIEDYGLIGDTRGSGLVSRSGDIDWLCVPRFDAEACFAALLGRDEHGRWSLRPTEAVLSSEDYHQRIDDPALEIDEDCILVVRNSGNIAYPGSAEVVNMQPPTELIMRGVEAIPTLGDGRQSGTADAPSILNISPEAAVGGNIAILRTGDRITLDIPNHRLDVDLSDEEIAERWRQYEPPAITHQTPWQELFRRYTGQMDAGSCLDFATAYQDIVVTKGIPRDSH
jgi:dihydroxy-acid dehydratase